MAKEGQEVNYWNVSREYKNKRLHNGVYLKTDRMIRLFKLPVIRKESLLHFNNKCKFVWNTALTEAVYIQKQ